MKVILRQMKINMILHPQTPFFPAGRRTKGLPLLLCTTYSICTLFIYTETAAALPLW